MLSCHCRFRQMNLLISINWITYLTTSIIVHYYCHIQESKKKSILCQQTDISKPSPKLENRTLYRRAVATSQVSTWLLYSWWLRPCIVFSLAKIQLRLEDLGLPDEIVNDVTTEEDLYMRVDYQHKLHNILIILWTLLHLRPCS